MKILKKTKQLNKRYATDIWMGKRVIMRIASLKRRVLEQKSKNEKSQL